MSHSPEPWREGADREIVDANGDFVADWEGNVQITPDNRARIIAAVNACRGIPTDELAKLREWREGLQHVVEQDVISWLQGRGYEVKEKTP